MLTAWKLANELWAAGWRQDRRLVVLAARYYRGLETRETLGRYLIPGDVEMVVRDR